MNVEPVPFITLLQGDTSPSFNSSPLSQMHRVSAPKSSITRRNTTCFVTRRNFISKVTAWKRDIIFAYYIWYIHIRTFLHMLLYRLLVLNSCDEQGNVPLHWAVERNKAESCKALLDLGANPNILNTALLSPLHLAVSHGHSNLVGVRRLIRHSWCNNLKDRKCVFLLNSCSQQGQRRAF